MNLPLNHSEPSLMHIDLNSCFATVEQQAYPSLRGKPLVIAAYTTPNGCVLAASIEAKRYGIKTGMRVRDAKLLYKNIIVRDPDPSMVRYVHLQLRNILNHYSTEVVPKSIDEFVINFSDMMAFKRDLTETGKEIKRKIRERVGEWLSCNIGISTNRFLAKLGSSLHKPDGLDVVNYKNLRDVYSKITLVDLPGINTRFQARLNACGIFTVLEFLEASARVLQKGVFKSIIGYHWYQRLRGYEVDDVEFKTKSIGQQYALKVQTSDIKELSRILMKLSEKMGRRLRDGGYSAGGIRIYCVYKDSSFWQKGMLFHTRLYTTRDLYQKALLILNSQPYKKVITQLSVSSYDLITKNDVQLGLFDEEKTKEDKISEALDKINDRFGEFTVTPATMLGTENVVLDRIAFGSVKAIRV